MTSKQEAKDALDSVIRKSRAHLYKPIQIETFGVDAAYRLGDKLVLQDIFGFSDKDIDGIRGVIQMLRSWRNPAKRRVFRLPVSEKILNPEIAVLTSARAI
jgi:hypothetical protein